MKSLPLHLLLLLLLLEGVVLTRASPKDKHSKVVSRCEVLGGIRQREPCAPRAQLLGPTGDKVFKHCCRVSNRRNQVKRKPIMKKYMFNKEKPVNIVKKKPMEKKKPIKVSSLTISKPIRGKNKRKKCKNQRKCKKAGGKCFPSTKICEKPIQEICKGDCTCCHQGCKTAKKCSKKGGSCRSRCGAEEKAVKGCKNGCTCCISDNTPGTGCGKYNPSRVVGGQPVFPANKYPWQVWLLDSDTFYLCGGSIISDRYVLTAGHCICHSNTKRLKVVVADHNKDSSSDDIDGVTRTVKVEEVIKYPGYSCSGSQVVDDIALLKLSETLDLCSYSQIRAVCLPPDDSSTYEGEDSIVTGWGLTDSQAFDLPSVLYEVTVPVLKPSCPGYGQAGIPLTDGMVCAGVANAGLDSCSGDSGGPLVVINKDEKFVQIGIVSFGPLDCLGTGTYTRVSKYLKWINESTKDGNLCT